MNHGMIVKYESHWAMPNMSNLGSCQGCVFNEPCTRLMPSFTSSPCRSLSGENVIIDCSWIKIS